MVHGSGVHCSRFPTGTSFTVTVSYPITRTRIVAIKSVSRYTYLITVMLYGVYFVFRANSQPVGICSGTSYTNLCARSNRSGISIFPYGNIRLNILRRVYPLTVLIIHRRQQGCPIVLRWEHDSSKRLLVNRLVDMSRPGTGNEQITREISGGRSRFPETPRTRRVPVTHKNTEPNIPNKCWTRKDHLRLSSWNLLIVIRFVKIRWNNGSGGSVFSARSSPPVVPFVFKIIRYLLAITIKR